MTKSNASNDANQEEVDPFDVPMDSIPTVNDLDVREEEPTMPKTDAEIQIEHMAQMLASGQLSSWETGFCQSCTKWLAADPYKNYLSYKQKDVLGKLVTKYMD